MDKNKNKKLGNLSYKEIALLIEILNFYEKFKTVTKVGRWVVLFILAVLFERFRAIDTIDNIIMHLKRWFAKI